MPPPTDVSIDRINKPDLPLASGALKQWQGGAVCLLCLALGLGGSYAVRASPFSSIPLLQTLFASAFLGTAYSLKPIRLKRFPTAAAFCILTVRGTIINVGFMAHSLATCFSGGGGAAAAAAAGVIGGSTLTLPFRNLKCGLATLYFAIFGSVIALMKDVPDLVGDKVHNIRSFAVRLGPKRVFEASTASLCALLDATGFGLLTGACVASLRMMGASSSSSMSASLSFPPMHPAAFIATSTASAVAARAAVGFAALAAAANTRREAKLVSPDNPKEVYTFYMWVWKLFYASYLALPLVR